MSNTESNRSKFVRGISTQSMITLVMGVLEIGFFAIMSRLLSKTDFGYFAALTGIMMICQSLSEAGLGSAVIQKKDASPTHISTAFTLSCVFGLIGSFTVFFLAPFLAKAVADESITTPLRFMASTIFLNSIISVGNAQLFRELKFKAIGMIQIVSYTLASAIGIGMAHAEHGLSAIVTFTVLYPLFTAVFLYTTNAKFPNLCINKYDAKNIVSFGGWLTLGVILNNITQQLDRLFLSKWISVQSLGSYNRPAGFAANIAGKINSIFDTVLFPMLSKIQDKKDNVLAVMYQAVAILNSFSVILGIMFFFNAELIIKIFFGNQWTDLAPVLRIVSITIIFNINGRLVDCFFRSLNLVKTGFYLRLIGAILTFILLYLGSRHGIMGVAFGLMCANVMMIIMKMTMLSIKIKADILVVATKWVRAWLPGLIPCAIGSAGLLLLPHKTSYQWVYLLTMCAVVFGEFLFVPKLVSKEYKENLYPTIQNILSSLAKKIYTKK